LAGILAGDSGRDATKPSARRKMLLRAARNSRNGHDAGDMCSFLRPAAKNSPDISPLLSAFRTHDLPNSLAVNTAEMPSALKPETKTTSKSRRVFTSA
jgi:hypothetical protein